MTPKEQALYDNFVARLNGKEAGGKPPFKDWSSAAKSMGKMKIPQKLKDEFQRMANEKFDRTEGVPANKPQKLKGTKVKELVESHNPPAPTPIVRTAVYGVIPEEVKAKLSFLADAIEGNVSVIQGLREAHEANPEVDVSEIQDTVNRLNVLNMHRNMEIDRILKSVYPVAAATPAPALQTTPPAPEPAAEQASKSEEEVVQAPAPPPVPTLGKRPFGSGFTKRAEASVETEPTVARAPIGFRMQTEPDPKEVEMLRRTAPRFLSPSGGMKIK